MTWGTIRTAGVLALLLSAGGCRIMGQDKKLTRPDQVGHMVFFTLHDNSIYEKQKLVRDAYAYLRNQPGVVYFSAGERVLTAETEVNDTEFDVALHMIFENADAYDAYQPSKKHLEFIERNERNWKRVRVFDSLIR